ncbi:MAG: hypothetical protein KAX49_13850 [Halanaerobiales bacterium]|nr:hypothetical protein [Halanaerobiales bacterium]
MKRKSFFGILIMLFMFIMLVTLPNQVKATDQMIEKGKQLYIQSRDLYYNNENDYLEIENILKESEAIFVEIEEGLEKYYWQAQIYLLLGEMAETREDKKIAEKRYSESQKLIKKALEYNENDSDSVRLLGVTYIKLMKYKSVFYRMKNSSKTKELSKKAIELDSKNYKAQIALSMFYIYTPKSVGGDIDKAIEGLNKALLSEDYYERFLAFGWLGFAYKKKNLNNFTKQYVDKALEIFPNSLWVNSILEDK